MTESVHNLQENELDVNCLFDKIYNEIVINSDLSAKYHTEIKERIKFTWEIIRSFLRKGDNVVEVGVGPMAPVLLSVENCVVTGVDISEKQKKLCNAFGIPLIKCNIEEASLPIKPKSVDLVLALELIEHLLLYPEILFERIKYVLKPGGLLVLTTVNFVRISNRIRMLTGQNPLINYFEKTDNGENHIREFDLNEMIYYFRKSGFGIEKICRFGLVNKGDRLKYLEKLLYLYPNFRNYFLIVGKMN